MNTKTMQGRIIIVAGGSGGIGSAASGLLASRGAVVIAAVRKDPCRETVPGVTFTETDLRVPENWASLRDSVIKQHGRIDVLVNSIGALMPGPFEDLSDEDIRGLIETNLLAALFGAKAVIPVMKRQRSGHIVNVSSLGGLVPMPFEALYSATKFAVRGFSLSLASELRGSGIEVSLVSPGAVRTKMLERASLDDRTRISFVTRPLSPLEVAHAILELLIKPRKEILLPAVSGRLALLTGRYPKLFRACLPVLNFIGGLRLRSYRRRYVTGDLPE